MATTKQNLKDFFALSGNNPIVTNAQLTKVQDWLAAGTNLVDVNGDPRIATSDDLVDWLYQAVKSNTIAYLKQQEIVTF